MYIFNHCRCALTPNAAEFDRLVTAAISHLEQQGQISTSEELSSSILAGLRSSVVAVRLHALSMYLGAQLFYLFNILCMYI